MSKNAKQVKVRVYKNIDKNFFFLKTYVFLYSSTDI